MQILRLSVSKEPGNGTSFIGEEMDTTYYAFSLKWIKRRGLDPKELHVIEVKGDSMESKLKHGDLILVDYSDIKPSDGSANVVRVMDDLVVKHVQPIGGEAIELISANSTYPPRELKPRDIEIMGRVVASMHEW